MRNSILVSVTAIIGLIVVVGAFTKLDTSHGDISEFVTFLSTILAAGIPAYFSMVKSSQAHSKASEVSDKVDSISNDVSDTKDAAQQAENNTNGRMAAQFSVIRDMISSVSSKLDDHLADHNGGH